MGAGAAAGHEHRVRAGREHRRARALDAECVVLLNNDARVDPAFVRSSSPASTPASGAVCVGARILSWDGETVDFVDGAVNYYGMGQQLATAARCGTCGARTAPSCSSPAAARCWCTGRCSSTSAASTRASSRTSRTSTSAGASGCAGFRVVLARRRPCAYHRMHGTSGAVPAAPALRAVRAQRAAHGHQELLRREPPAGPRPGPAAAGQARAAARRPRTRRRTTSPATRAPTETVPRLALAHLHAIGDLVDDLDALMRTRAEIQRAQQAGRTTRSCRGSSGRCGR